MNDGRARGEWIQRRGMWRGFLGVFAGGSRCVGERAREGLMLGYVRESECERARVYCTSYAWDVLVSAWDCLGGGVEVEGR